MADEQVLKGRIFPSAPGLKSHQPHVYDESSQTHPAGVGDGRDRTAEEVWGGKGALYGQCAQRHRRALAVLLT
jgi:hypothetical protein